MLNDSIVQFASRCGAVYTDPEERCPEAGLCWDRDGDGYCDMCKEEIGDEPLPCRYVGGYFWHVDLSEVFFNEWIGKLPQSLGMADWPEWLLKVVYYATFGWLTIWIF